MQGKKNLKEKFRSEEKLHNTSDVLNVLKLKVNFNKANDHNRRNMTPRLAQ